MPMHKALHPRDDVDRLYVSSKEGRRGLASVDASIQRFEDYIEKHEKNKQTDYNHQKRYGQHDRR